MTNMQAAIGLAQLESLEDHLVKKRHIGKMYNELLSGVPGITLPQADTSYASNLYWVFGVVVEDDVFSDAFELTELLGARGIGTRPFFWPIHEQPVLLRMGLFSKVSHPVSEKLARRGFYLPSGLALTESQITKSAKTLKDILA